MVYYNNGLKELLKKLPKYVDWPIISLKMDDLAQTYIKRMDRIRCNPEYKININDSTHVIESVDITSSGDCEIPLFVSKTGEIDSTTVDSIEQVGNDPKTAWIKLTGGTPRSVKFVGDVMWDGDAESFWNNQSGNGVPATTEAPAGQNVVDSSILDGTKLTATISYKEENTQPDVNIVAPSFIYIPEGSLPKYVKFTHSEGLNEEGKAAFADPASIPVLSWKWGYDETTGYWETWSWDNVPEQYKKYFSVF